MIPIKKIPCDDIAPVVLKLSEQVGIIKHELVDSHVIDMAEVENVLNQIQSSLHDIQAWVADMYRSKVANQP